MITIALSFAQDPKQLDIKNAFFNDDFNEEVYMFQPQGYEETSSPNLVR